VPGDAAASFTPLLTATTRAGTTIVATLGAAGRDAGNAITSGLVGGPQRPPTRKSRASPSARTRLERAQLLSGLAQQGERAGGLLVSGVVQAITAGSGRDRTGGGGRARARESADGAPRRDGGRRRPKPRASCRSSPHRHEAARGLIGSITRELVSGSATAVTQFSRAVSTALAGTNLLGDVTSVGDRAGLQLSAGVQGALGRESTALRTAITAAIVPADIGARSRGSSRR
jgi:hypothetical protein